MPSAPACRPPATKSIGVAWSSWPRTPEFLEFLHREFPRQAADWDESFGRRGFLKLMAASLSLAGATGCLLRQPEEKIVPYVPPAGDDRSGRRTVLCHGHDAGGLRSGSVGRQPDGPADQGRRQSRASGQSGGDRHFLVRRRSCRCTIPTVPRPWCFAATSRPGIIFFARWPPRCRGSRVPAARGWRS